MSLAPILSNMNEADKLDVLIFGGGVAGLWLLAALTAEKHHCLLIERKRLGEGQTAAAQGILHGGLKYSLRRLLWQGLGAIREMPERWRQHLQGERVPDLSNTRVRSDHCYLWNSESLQSRLGMWGARANLHVKPVLLKDDERPELLRNCPGTVARLDEWVIDPQSLLNNLRSKAAERILHVTARQRLHFRRCSDDYHVELKHPDTGLSLSLHPRTIIFAAGEGNEALRQQAGLSNNSMQRRPLHMTMVRGALPLFNGHCLDGAKTRLSISSDRDSSGAVIWQLGGQVAEDGVQMNPRDCIAHAYAECRAVLPDQPFKDTVWSSYRIDRAEAKAPLGFGPDDIGLLIDDRTLTVWPTKLVLTPRLVDTVLAQLTPARDRNDLLDLAAIAPWPRPEIAPAPWEKKIRWTTVA